MTAVRNIANTASMTVAISVSMTVASSTAMTVASSAVMNVASSAAMTGASSAAMTVASSAAMSVAISAAMSVASSVAMTVASSVAMTVASSAAMTVKVANCYDCCLLESPGVHAGGLVEPGECPVVPLIEPPVPHGGQVLQASLACRSHSSLPASSSHQPSPPGCQAWRWPCPAAR